MATVKVLGARVVGDAFDTPRGANRSAAVIAVTQKGAVLLHKVRHTNRVRVQQFADAVSEAGAVNSDFWVEIDGTRLLLDMKFVQKDGADIPGQRTGQAYAEVRPVNGGFELFPQEVEAEPLADF